MRNSLVCLLLTVVGCASDYAEAPEMRATEDGSTAALVQINSSPTEAWIFVDGEYAGITPMEQELSFWAATRYVEVVAVPMYPAQARQVKRLRVPPLPHTLFFNMNNPPVMASSE
ncbi:MAG: hypothetical protein JSW21_01620 [Gammaproteobacteria bacterium]|nr:MAG: hypothetical protein JSW21_01620 [Gammaproteobacteria bacterium]